MPVQPITPGPGYIYGTYSFLNIMCSITGPNGNVTIGAGSGAAEEGITVEPTGDIRGVARLVKEVIAATQ